MAGGRPIDLPSAMSAFGEPRCRPLRPGWALSGPDHIQCSGSANRTKRIASHLPLPVDGNCLQEPSERDLRGLSVEDPLHKVGSE